mmetsp:Transcript_46017/g.118163  ORF Transcript_46017/g.118163 Transcript_46017/m.118163 type:complete len:323 (-) Transcript_46017:422-1390(-)
MHHLLHTFLLPPELILHVKAAPLLLLGHLPALRCRGILLGAVSRSPAQLRAGLGEHGPALNLEAPPVLDASLLELCPRLARVAELRLELLHVLLELALLREHLPLPLLALPALILQRLVQVLLHSLELDDVLLGPPQTAVDLLSLNLGMLGLGSAANEFRRGLPGRGLGRVGVGLGRVGPLASEFHPFIRLVELLLLDSPQPRRRLCLRLGLLHRKLQGSRLVDERLDLLESRLLHGTSCHFGRCLFLLKSRQILLLTRMQALELGGPVLGTAEFAGEFPDLILQVLGAAEFLGEFPDLLLQVPDSVVCGCSYGLCCRCCRC